jgi:hypothetical protein
MTCHVRSGCTGTARWASTILAATVVAAASPAMVFITMPGVIVATPIFFLSMFKRGRKIVGAINEVSADVRVKLNLVSELAITIVFDIHRDRSNKLVMIAEASAIFKRSPTGYHWK